MPIAAATRISGRHHVAVWFSSDEISEGLARMRGRDAGRFNAGAGGRGARALQGPSDDQGQVANQGLVFGGRDFDDKRWLFQVLDAVTSIG
jgi:hypothetical protein